MAQSEQQVAEMAGNSTSKSDIATTASQDAADILSILDSFGVHQPSADRLPKDLPLTAEEQKKLTNLLGDTKPKIEAKSNVTNVQDLPAKEPSSQKSEETESLLARAQSQLETVTNEQDRTRMNKEITHLRSELAEITKGHDSLVAQVQKQLGLLEDSTANRETLEADLNQAHKTIGSLQKEVQSLQWKLTDCDSMVTELRAQLVDQTGKMTTNHEKLQHEVTQRRQAEKMLREIKSRLVLLTQSKSVTQTKSSHN